MEQHKYLKIISTSLTCHLKEEKDKSEILFKHKQNDKLF